MKRKYLSSLLVASMCVSLTACGTAKSNQPASDKPEATPSASGYTAGTYSASAPGNNGPVTVEVTFSESEIVSVEIKEHSETAGICEAPFERIPAAIISGQTLNVDTVSGATNASNAVIEAVADCVQQAGVDVEALKNMASAEKDLVKEELSCDVVVVGAGAAGSAAALSAAQSGAKVILIEKTSSPSGAGTMAGALFATNSDLQIEAGNEVDPEWYYETYIKDSSYFANARLVSTIISESSETVNWLVKNDVNLVSLKSGHGSQYAHVDFPATAHGYVDGGTAAITNLCDKVKEAGSEVMFDTVGKELIFNEDGTVGGVIAETVDGRELHILAGSVVIATGGFGGNAEMMAEIFGEKAGTGLIASNTGDGIKMAWSAGAAELGLL